MTAGGFSRKRLTRVRDVLGRCVDDGYFPGAVAVVARHGEVHIEATGSLAFEGAGSGAPVAADTIFRIASMTKPVVAACAMTLVEDGTLRLDDPVDDFLPELADLTVLAGADGPPEGTVPVKRPITLRDLLIFTAGIGQHEGPELAPDEWIRRLGERPLLHQPGERWVYSAAADVTGVLIARATGVSLGDALRERVCEPLAMLDTAFTAGGESTGRLATAYQSADDGETAAVVADGPGGRWSHPPVFEGGGGGLVSTAADYLAFASALLAGGTRHGERVLSRPSVTLMTSDHLTPAQKAAAESPVSQSPLGTFDDIGWGFGMSVRTRRTHLGPSAGSYGWTGFWGTAWFNDPAEDMTVILMIQRVLAPQVQRILLDFWTAAYQAIDD